MFLGVNGIRLTTARSGVARYIENVLRQWSAMEHPFEEVRVYTPKPVELNLPRTRNVVVQGHKPLWMWEQFALPKAHGRVELLVCPSYVAPLRANCPLLLIHHGSYEGYPQAFGRWATKKALWAYKLSARRADRIITVSQHSQRDIVKFYGVGADKIDVIPEGVDTSLFRPIRDASALSAFRTQAFGADEPFILFVGKPARRRNIPQLFEAYKRLLRDGKIKHRFLFIGSDLPGSPVGKLVRDLGLEKHVTLVGHAGHEQIVLAYNAADVLIYPSSYEGFGMPVLEAMACGTPAIALRNTAFLEFAAGIAYLAEDGSVDELYKALDTVLHDETMRQKMRRLGPARASRYDWQQIAQRTMDVALDMIGVPAAAGAVERSTLWSAMVREESQYVPAGNEER